MCIGFCDIACSFSRWSKGFNSKVFREIQGIVYFLVDLVSRYCILIGHKDRRNERFHSQCLAERFRIDSGF